MENAGFLRDIIRSVFSEGGLVAGLSVLLNVYLFWQLAKERKSHEDDNRVAREDAKARAAAEMENARRGDQLVATIERLASGRRDG